MVIFLDFDGVLNGDDPKVNNNKKYLDYCEENKERIDYINSFYTSNSKMYLLSQINHSSVSVLNDIVDYFRDVEIILSTSLASKDNLELLKYILSVKEFKYPSIIKGVLPRLKEGKRGYWIKEYIEERGVKDYLILDDEEFDIKEYHKKDKYYKVSGGLDKLDLKLIKYIDLKGLRLNCEFYN